MSDQDPEPTVRNPLVRGLLLCLGLFFSTLALVGAFLPVLPTTPFLLVAAACFARSSPAFHKRLLANRAFGPYIAQWQREHTVPREAKLKAYGLLAVSFSTSVYLLEETWVRVVLIAVGCCLFVFLARLPTAASESEPGE